MPGGSQLAANILLTALLLAFLGCQSGGEPTPEPTPSSSVGVPQGEASRRARELQGIGPDDILPYEGRYSSDPRLDQRVRELRSLYPTVLEEVRHRLGYSEAPLPRIRVRLFDTRSYKLEDHNGAEVSKEVMDDGTFMVISFRTEPLVTGEYDLRYLLGHEFAHCFQRWPAGSGAGEVPAWVFEGLAEWGSGVGMKGLTASYLDPSHGSSVESVYWVASLDRLELSMQRGAYREAFLAFAMIEEQHGPDAIRALIRELDRNPDGKAAIRIVTGLPYEQFVREAGKWALARIRADNKDREAYFQGKRALEARKFAEASVAYDQFLTEHPDSIYLSLAYAERCACRLETGDISGAEADLAASKASDLGVGGLRRMHRWLDIAIDAKRERWREVEWKAGLFCFDYEVEGGLFTDRVYVLLRMAQDELRTGTHKK